MILHGRLLIDPAEAVRPGWVAVENGRIAEVGHGEPREKAAAGDASSIICPGFVDAHMHVPQVDAIGYDGLDLLDWLDRVIFPAEARWIDTRYAEAQTRRAFERMLGAGTLTFAGFLSPHPHATAVVARVHRDLPLRAVVGQTWMDRAAPAELLAAPLPPPAPLSHPAPGGERLSFSVNPRFAISCTPALLSHAGALAAAGAIVQTHLAEQVRECAEVRRLFPDDSSYAAVYDRFGLLGPRTLLAHAVHMSEDDWALVAARRSTIVHCPTANTFLQSGLFDLDRARTSGVRLALGSDVAAGPDHAMPRVARAMIETAKVRRMTVAPRAHIPTPAEAWRLITSGNAEALGIPSGGRIERGAPADLLVLRTPFDELDGPTLAARLIYTWREDYITHSVLAGSLRAAPG